MNLASRLREKKLCKIYDIWGAEKAKILPGKYDIIQGGLRLVQGPAGIPGWGMGVGRRQLWDETISCKYTEMRLWAGFEELAETKAL